MSNFQLSKQADPNKIFLIKFSELEGGRFDPVMALYQREIKNFNFQTQNLSDLLQSNPQYGANESGIDRKSKTEPRYIRITDINKYGLLRNNLGKTAKILENQYLLSSDDILIARSGATVGKAYIHRVKNEKCFYAGYLIRFIVDKNKVSPNYIFYYMQLKVYEKWVNAIQRASGQPNINAEEYKSLKIPIPPKNIQADIVAKMDKAYQDKQKKEVQAQDLLNGIDNYLLSELGIDLPKKIDNSLKSRMFIKKFSEVANSRLDPFFNQPLFAQAEKNIVSGDFSCISLDALVFPVSGITYKATDEAKSGHAILRGNNVTLNTNELNFEKIRFIDKNLSINVLSKLYKNDILMSSASGSKEHVGKVAFIDKDINYYFGAFMTVLRPKKMEYSHKYLFNFLSSKIYRLMLFRFLGGTNINNVGFEKIKNFPVPLPPLEKQNQIAEHISQIRQQAKQLQTEAKIGLTQAKSEVETIILGGEL